MTPREAIPREWIDVLSRGEPCAIGLDLATTTNKKSNPSALTVAQSHAGKVWERLNLRWKTDREAVTRAILRTVILDMKAAEVHLRRICVDGSNERFFCDSLQKEFSIYAPVDAIVSGEKPDEKLYPAGQGMLWKQFLGSGYVSVYEDALIAIANAEWLKRDRRSVLRDKGTFLNTLDEDGNHGDTWDSGKLARHGLQRGGGAEAHATSLGGIGGNKPSTMPRKRTIFTRLKAHVRRHF